MPAQKTNSATTTKRYALCIGIGKYTDPSMLNRNLRYAPADAKALAEALQNPRQGAFDKVEVRTTPEETTEPELRGALTKFLTGPTRKPEDLALIFISGHGGSFDKGETFYLYPSNALIKPDWQPDISTVLDVFDLAKLINASAIKNIIIWLDVCYAGGAAEVSNLLGFRRVSNTNLFIAGAARHDHQAEERSELQHGVFTYCLLEAFRQKPARPDGWLTLSEIQSFIDQKIKQYSEIIQFPASMRAEGLLSKPLVQNPLYLRDNLEFYRQVKEVLGLEGFRPEPELETSEALPSYYIANSGEGRNRHRKGILALDNEVVITTPDFIDKISPFLKAQIETEEVDKLLLVTKHQLEAGIRQALSQAVGGRRWIDFDTYDAILNTLINFENFLERWRKEYEEEPRVSKDPDISLSQVYTALRAEKRSYKEHSDKNGDFAYSALSHRNKPKLKRDEETGQPYEVEKVGDLHQLVEEWLTDPKQSRLALLGNYGTGKSSYCLHLTATLISKQGQPGVRIPIYVPLRLFSKGEPHLKRLAEYIGDESGDTSTPAPNLKALKKMASTGRLLFILDGFDEMATQADAIQIQQNIQLFEELAGIPNNKVLLTTRPEYFVRRGEEGKILENYDRLYLQPFSTGEVLEYLRKRLGLEQAQQEWAEICQIYDLPDLAERPVFLEMIVKALPELHRIKEKGERVSRPKLYESYLRGELKRQHLEKRRSDLRIADDKRFQIMEQIALELYRTGKFQEGLNESEIQRLFRDNPVLSEEERGKLERTTHEIVTCSFLINPQGNYYFSHKSFQEYLTARCLRRALLQGDQADFALSVLSIPTLEFLAEMLEPENPPELETVKGWLQETTDIPAANGEVEFRPLQQNAAGLLLAHRVLALPLQQPSSYLTCAEYQLFVDEWQNNNNVYYQPAHWQTYRFAPGQALAPVRGVGFFEAKSFCYWLCNRHKGSFVYTLPAQDSFDQTSLPGFEDLTTWTRQGELVGLSDSFARELRAALASITGFSSVLDLSLDLASDHASDRALDLARATEHANDLANNLVRARAFDLASTRASARDLASATELANNLTSDFVSALALASALTSALKLANATELANNLASATKLALATELALALADTLALARDFARHLSLDRTSASTRILGSAGEREFKELVELMRNRRKKEALKLAQKLSLSPVLPAPSQRLVTLLADLLEMETATTFPALSRAQRSYVNHFSEYVQIGYAELEQFEKAPNKYAEDKALMDELKAWVKMVEARIEGKLPVWEGIRLVREPRKRDD